MLIHSFLPEPLTCYREIVNDTPLRIGDIIDVTTERIAYGADAVARHEGLAVFVPFAAPGERLRIRITGRKKNFARGVIDQILEPSLSRTEPLCQYFGVCGGCQLQHMAYQAQLESKMGFVRDALERIGRIDWPHEIVIRSGGEFGYRARTQIKLDGKTGQIGYNRASSNTVCDIEECPILVPELNRALHSLRGAFSAAAGTNDAPANPSQTEMGAGESAVSFEPSFKGLPEGALHRTVRDAVYSFSPSTFFQANAGLLDAMIDEALGEVSGSHAIDLYAGVGFFTLQLARRFHRVAGVEADPGAARFARENITANSTANVEFHESAAEPWLEKTLASGGQPPDLILLNPPRTGAAGAVPHIAALKPSRISYVSCDPTTLARDLRPLLDSGYELSRVTAIDLFPQTYHVETVAVLERR